MKRKATKPKPKQKHKIITVDIGVGIAVQASQCELDPNVYHCDPLDVLSAILEAFEGMFDAEIDRRKGSRHEH